MSLPHILAGLLHSPMSGYALKQEFENSLGHFWNANLSQIYPTLKKMTADGWVVHEQAAPDRGPARIVYTRTELGKDNLQAWLLNGPANKPKRSHDVAQVYFLNDMRDGNEAITFLEALLEDLLQWQSTMVSIEFAWRGDQGETFLEALPPEDFYPYLTLELGLRQCGDKIAWCKDSIARTKSRFNID